MGLSVWVLKNNIIIINSLFKVGVGDSTRLINANHNYNSMKLEN